MDAVTLINSQLDEGIVSILNHYRFAQITRNSVNIRACCAIHGGDNPSAFMWNNERKLWICWTGSCGGGDIYTLIEKMEGCRFQEAVKKAAEILHLDIDNMDISIERNRITKEHYDWLQKELRKTKQDELGTYIPPKLTYYLPSKTMLGHSPETLQHFQVMMVKEYPLREHALPAVHSYPTCFVIPLWFGGILRGVMLRDLTGTMVKQKWFIRPAGLNKGLMLYNYDSVVACEDALEEVILVEGIRDVWAYHEVGLDNVVACLGSHMSDEQINLILKLGCNVTLSFDHDKAGLKATKNVVKKLLHKCELRRILLPEGCDPNDLSKEERIQCYMNRKRINSVKTLELD